MKEVAILEYMFMFDPGATWQTGSDFESDLIEFFAMHGKTVSIIDSTGTTHKRVVCISMADAFDNPPIPELPKPRSVQEVLKRIQQGKSAS